MTKIRVDTTEGQRPPSRKRNTSIGLRIGLLLVTVVAVWYQQKNGSLKIRSLEDSKLVKDVATVFSSAEEKNRETPSLRRSPVATAETAESLPTPTSYSPSPLEDYVITHAEELGYNGTRSKDAAPGCNIWTNETLTPIYDHLHIFKKELEDYNAALAAFNFSNIPKDMRKHITEDDKSACDLLELHPDGLSGIFSSGSLSTLPGSSGGMEPLMTPLRHPEMCFTRRGNIMNMKYLIHDFASICRHNLKPTSRTIFIDMGAVLDFYSGQDSPAVYVTEMYQKFGFHFDHIYAYEINQKEPDQVFQLIPDSLKAAYHWYNIGVDADINSSKNPLKMLLDEYTEDDFVVVKLDIDTSFIDVPMAEYVAKDERLHQIIDAFYFEHHVYLAELAYAWGRTMSGSVQGSLELFQTMRQKGIASHYWP